MQSYEETNIDFETSTNEIKINPSKNIDEEEKNDLKIKEESQRPIQSQRQYQSQSQKQIEQEKKKPLKSK